MKIINLIKLIIKGYIKGSSSQTNFIPQLYPKINQGKYEFGFADCNGHLVIDYIFDFAYSFSGDYAIVSKQNKWGMIDKKGNFVISNNYNEILPVSEGLVGVKTKEKWGFKNLRNEFIIKPMFDDVRSFSGGLAAVKKNEKWGFINREGEVIIEFLYTDAKDYSEGLIAVKTENGWGFIDEQNKIKIDFKYDDVGYSNKDYNFIQGTVVVQKYITEYIKYNEEYDEVLYTMLIDKNDKFLADLGSSFNEDYAMSERDNKLYHRSGNAITLDGVLKESFYRGSFSCGLAPVTKDYNKYQWGFVNKDNKLIIPFQYSTIFYMHDFVPKFEENVCLMKLKNKNYKSDTYVIINIKGKIIKKINSFDFSIKSNFKEGLAIARNKNNELYGFINNLGQLVISTKYKKVKEFDRGLAIAKMNKSKGYVDRWGNDTF